jgi:DNA-damage-inducible protein J
MTQIASTIQIRIDSKLKKQVSSLFADLGTDISGAIKMFLTQSLKTKTLAIKGLTENGFTDAEEKRILKAIQESRDPKNLKEYDSMEELLIDLRKEI